jgi:hypothetical protein
MAEVDRPLWGALRDEIGSLRADLREMAALRWELARLEVAESFGNLKRLAIVLPVAGVMVITALPILAVAASEVLAGRLGVDRIGWLLILGVGLLVGGLAIGYLAWRRFRRRFTGIEQTLEELREDVVWLKDFTARTAEDRE